MIDDEKHTYTLHIALAARDDRHSIQISEKVRDLIEQYRQFIEWDLPKDEHVFMDGVEGPDVIDHLDVTDSDDWAEHVPIRDECSSCGGPGTNRLRTGVGRRSCKDCLGKNGSWYGLYLIHDVVSEGSTREHTP